jgi:hypothetical protein
MFCNDSRGAFALRALLLLTVVASFSGCSLQKLTVNQTADVLYTGAPALEREADVQFAREALPASLKTVESFLLTAPDNEKLLEIVAKGYFSYSFGFLEWDLERGQYELMEDEQLDELNRRAVLHYLRARDYGFLLAGDEELEKAAKAGDIAKLEDRLNKVKAKNVAGLFWAGYGWGGAINLSQDNPDMVAKLGVVEKIMQRVTELDDEYFYSGVHTFWAVYYASRPEIAGGNPAKSLEHFDIALGRHGEDNMLIHFLKARFYAPTQQDRAMFVETMQKVANANAEGDPNLRLNNEIARERAIWWLDHVDELIFE